MKKLNRLEYIAENLRVHANVCAMADKKETAEMLRFMPTK